MGPGRADQEWPTSPPRLVPQSDGYADYIDQPRVGQAGCLRGSDGAARAARPGSCRPGTGGLRGPAAPQGRGQEDRAGAPAVDPVHDHDPAGHPAALPHRALGVRRGEHGRRGHRQQERQHAQPGRWRPDRERWWGRFKPKGRTPSSGRARTPCTRARTAASGQGGRGNEREQGRDGRAAPAHRHRHRRVPGRRREGGQP